MAAFPLRRLPRLLTRAGHRAVLDLEDKFGVKTCGDLGKDAASHSKAELVARYGKVPGEWLYTRARGEDDDLVAEKGPQKSLACSMSLIPFGPKEDQLDRVLRMLATEIADRLAKDVRILLTAHSSNSLLTLSSFSSSSGSRTNLRLCTASCMGRRSIATLPLV